MAKRFSLLSVPSIFSEEAGNNADLKYDFSKVNYIYNQLSQIYMLEFTIKINYIN